MKGDEVAFEKRLSRRSVIAIAKKLGVKSVLGRMSTQEIVAAIKARERILADKALEVLDDAAGHTDSHEDRS